MFQALDAAEVTRLEDELVPERVRLLLTRRLRDAFRSDSGDQWRDLERMNAIVNIARAAQGLSVYVLRADDWGDYHEAEYAYHRGEIELACRRPSTRDLVEVLGDLIAEGWLDVDGVNADLGSGGATFSFRRQGDRGVACDVPPVSEIPPADEVNEHPNIRFLFARAEALLEKSDPAGVVHACGTVLETLAKDVVARASVQDKSLGAFFDAFRLKTKLPKELADFAKEIFNRRNTEPLSGHGHLSPPTVTVAEATTMLEFTRAMVRVERKLASPQAATATGGSNAVVKE